jgi:hypothetical protein
MEGNRETPEREEREERATGTSKANTLRLVKEWYTLESRGWRRYSPHNTTWALLPVARTTTSQWSSALPTQASSAVSTTIHGEARWRLRPWFVRWPPNLPDAPGRRLNSCCVCGNVVCML